MNATARLALDARRFGWRLLRYARSACGIRSTTYVEERTAEYLAYWQQAARALSATLSPVCDGVWEVRRGERRCRIANHLVPIDDPVTLRVAGNKPYCSQRARELGIPVPACRPFTLERIEDACAFLSALGTACVVKPASRSSSGMGISLMVRTRRQLASAAALASLYGDDLLIEAMVPAESCRLLYLDGKLIHAVRRRGVRMVGDGRSTIEHLLAARGLRHLAGDKATAVTLDAQGLCIQSRPRAGAELVVRYLPAGERVVREHRTVYDETITDRVCPQLAHSLAAVVRDIGSRLAGVDVLTNDPGVPLERSGGVFLELNTTPGLHHHYTDAGTDAPAVQVLRYLLDGSKEAEPAPEPAFSVAG